MHRVCSRLRPRGHEGYALGDVKTFPALSLALAVGAGLAFGTAACSSPLKAPTVQGPPPEYVPPTPATGQSASSAPSAPSAPSTPSAPDKTLGPPPLPLTVPARPAGVDGGAADSGRPAVSNTGVWLIGAWAAAATCGEKNEKWEGDGTTER